jgi:PEP-CTERM motif
MTRILRAIAVPVLGVLMLVAPAQASIVPVTLQFSNPSWSGAVSFDDTTGLPWVNIPTLTAYEITDMAISDDVRTWTEDEIDPFWVPPIGALILDANGRAILWLVATDTSTGVDLSTSISVTGDLITATALNAGSSPDFLSQTDYIGSVAAAVPLPSTLLLVASGLVGLGSVAWRRRR